MNLYELLDKINDRRLDDLIKGIQGERNPISDPGQEMATDKHLEGRNHTARDQDGGRSRQWPPELDDLPDCCLAIALDCEGGAPGPKDIVDYCWLVPGYEELLSKDDEKTLREKYGAHSI
jgi:hypothetical protein